MTKEGRAQTVAEELRLAHEELRASSLLLDVGLARVALTRAYFAVFHALRGLLYARNLEPRTHSGVQHLVNVHFIRTGELAPAVARLAARLQRYREEADYTESFVVDDAGAREELSAARVLVEDITARLNANAEPSGAAH